MGTATTELGNVNVHPDLQDFSVWNLAPVERMVGDVWDVVDVEIAVTVIMSLENAGAQGAGWGKTVHNPVRLESLVQIVFIIVTAITVSHYKAT